MKFKIKYLRITIISTILFLNVFTFMINITYALNNDAEGLTADFLRGLGIPSKAEVEKKTVLIPRLNNASSNTLNSFPTKSEFKIQESFSLPGWGGAGFMFRKNITVDSSKVLSDLSDFPKKK